MLTLIYEFICFYFDQLINGMFLFCLGMCGPFSHFRFMKQIRMEKRQNFLPQSLFHFHFLVNKKRRQESLLSQVIKFHKSKNKLINNNTYYIYIAVFQANTKISLLHPIMLTHFDTSASNKTVTL